MNAAARPVMMSGLPQQVQYTGGLQPQRMTTTMPQASQMRVLQPMANAPQRMTSQRMASMAGAQPLPQLAVPQLAFPSGTGVTSSVMHAPRGFVPRSYVAAPPMASLPSRPSVQSQFAPALKTMPVESKPSPMREASPQSSVETVETAATENQVVAEKLYAEPSPTMQLVSEEFAAPPTATLPLASKEDEKTAEAPVTKIAAVEEKVEEGSTLVPVAVKQPASCFDAILAFLPCGKGQ